MEMKKHELVDQFLGRITDMSNNDELTGEHKKAEYADYQEWALGEMILNNQ